MKLNISKCGLVYDGHIELDIDRGPNDDVWSVHYSARVRVGKDVWRKFIGVTHEKSGSVEIPKAILSDNFVMENSVIEYSGITLTKVDNVHWNFSGHGVSGSVEILLNGDPVEPLAVSINTPIGQINAHV